jgi:hypothetical protein
VPISLSPLGEMPARETHGVTLAKVQMPHPAELTEMAICAFQGASRKKRLPRGGAIVMLLVPLLVVTV